MKKTLLLLILAFALKSCAFNTETGKYAFDNFKNTPLSELAEAIKTEDFTKIKALLKDRKLPIDFKDPKYGQTLLSLTIPNNKRTAFIELLKSDADPNKLIGEINDSTPFITAISNVGNCDLFFVEAMLKHGANPNLEIKNPNPEYDFQNSFPLLVAIGITNNEGKECLNLIKLLVNHGADINCCFKQPESDLCEGVIAYSLLSNSMETLKYFVIEQKINIPDTVIIAGDLDDSTREAFGLKEILNTREYQFENLEREGRKYDQSHLKKIKNEILDYLNKNTRKQKR